MSVRRVVRALTLHRWPAGAVEAGNDYYIVVHPEHTARCLDCDARAQDVINAAASYEAVLRCDSQDRR